MLIKILGVEIPKQSKISASKAGGCILNKGGIRLADNFLMTKHVLYNTLHVLQAMVDDT